MSRRKKEGKREKEREEKKIKFEKEEEKGVQDEEFSQMELSEGGNFLHFFPFFYFIP